jgi:hypothetical protein
VGDHANGVAIDVDTPYRGSQVSSFVYA